MQREQSEKVLSNLIRPEPCGRTAEILSELLDDLDVNTCGILSVDVNTCGILSVISTLEFLQHHFS